ncbi:uncharacterized protein LOC134210451 [Armigeres subalbatus]|uniref:uncharacterized protein LOC134210451 n=1 Tax=Armigeres subalbatus TaxID=124917 RepID=UPI002ED6297C
MDICRLCMECKENSLVSIFSIINDVNIATTVIFSCSIQIVEGDGLPSKICETCIKDVQIVQAFVEKVRNADTILRNGKHQKKDKVEFEVIVVKTELSDDENGVIVGGDNDLNYVELKSESDSEDEKLSTIKARMKTSKRKNVDTLKKKGKRSSKRKTDSDIDSEAPDDHDSLDEKELEVFETIILPKINFVCCGCYQYFGTQEEFETHIEVHTKSVVKKTDTIYCEICKRKFNKMKALEKHNKRLKTLTKLFECRKCRIRLISAVSRRRHAYRHPKTIEDKMKQEFGEILCCVTNCSKSYPSEAQLIKHSQEDHKVHKRAYVGDDDAQKPSECPVCYKRFASVLLLRRHRKRNSRPMSHQCATCGLKFRSRDVLLLHETNHAGKKPFECSICKKRFGSSNALKAHQRYHSDEKPFVCATCGAGFYQKAQLVMHEYDHSSTPFPFKCEVCSKPFKVKAGLINHMRLHTGERPFPCRHCSMSFSNNTTRYRHEMNHTGDKPFKCTFCDKKFTIKRLQVEHECKHTGIKPYKCSYCDKTFIRKRFQIDHESSHTGVKPYGCDLCNRSFSHKTGLRRHRLEVHHLEGRENRTTVESPHVVTVSVSNSTYESTGRTNTSLNEYSRPNSSSECWVPEQHKSEKNGSTNSVTKDDKCINCGGKHQAGNKMCKERKRRENILNTMRTEKLTYAEAEEQFPKLSNRFNILEVDSNEEFPELNDVGGQGSRREARRSEGTTSRQVKRKTQGSSRNDWVGLPPGNVDQGFDVILVETVLARLREDLIKQLRWKAWLKPLVELRNHIAQRMQQEHNELDTDQPIVYIFSKINEIIDNNAGAQQEERIVQENRNGNLAQREHFRMKNFELASKRRPEGYGGVGILIQQGMEFKNIRMPDFIILEAVGVKISNGGDPVNLISAYLPAGPINQVTDDHSIYFGGWNNWKVNSTMCLAPGNRDSAIDLTLVTEGMARKARWKVLDEEFGSAHLSIRIGIGDDIPVIRQICKRVNQDKAIDLLDKMRPQYFYDPEEMQNIFEEVIEEASYVVKNKKGNYLKKWWNESISELYKAKREALRNYNHNKSERNYLELQRRRAGSSASCMFDAFLHSFDTLHLATRETESRMNFVKPPEFNVGDSWPLYEERLKRFFVAYQIDDKDDKRKSAFLLTAVSMEVYQIVKNLTFPALPENKKFSELCDLLKQRFTPTLVVFRERAKFFEARQGEGESIVEWSTRLKKLAANCEFGDQLNPFLLNIFVTGMRRGPIFERLCEEEATSTLENLLKIAMKRESTMQQREVLEVHKIQVHEQKKKYKNEAKCYACGQGDHDFKKCQYKSYICRNCDNKGHLAKVCPSRDKKQSREKHSLKVNHLRINKLDVPPPVEIQVVVNKHPVNFEVDTGSPVNAISKSMYDRLFQDIPLKTNSTEEFLCYNGSGFRAVGTFKAIMRYKEHESLEEKHEAGYSVIDREALAIYYGINKFSNYLFGRHFELMTDHKPLTGLFNPGSKGIPSIAAGRLQRWAAFLANYDYEIRHVKGVHNVPADFLSRFPLRCEDDENDEDAVSFLNFIEVETRSLVERKQIVVESRRDKLISRVVNYVQSGWPNMIQEDELKTFYQKRDELSVEEGVLLWGYRIVVPTKLRKMLLDELHKCDTIEKVNTKKKPLTFVVGETVYVRDYRNPKKATWMRGKFLKKLGAVLFECSSDELGTIKRRSNQILKYPYDDYEEGKRNTNHCDFNNDDADSDASYVSLEDDTEEIRTNHQLSGTYVTRISAKYSHNMNICRVCMENEETSGGHDLIPIFSKLEDAFIANIIVECTSIQILEDDGLPTTICQVCVDVLKSFIGFIRKARESDRKLRKMFKSESSGRPRVDEVEADGREQEEDKNWNPPLELSVFTEMMEVKEELDSEDEKVIEDESHRNDVDEATYDAEYLDDANDSDWKNPNSDTEDKKPVRRRGRRKKYKNSDDSDSEGLTTLAEIQKPRRGRKPGRKASTRVDDDYEDYTSDNVLDETELATYNVITIEQSQLVCCSCLLIFDSSEALDLHSEKHAKKRRVNMTKTNICQVCHRRYSTPYALKQHYRRRKEASKIYECIKCPARFIDQKRRWQHAHNHPREKEIVPSKVIVASIPAVIQEEYGKICCAQACYQSFETEELLLAHAHTAHKVNKVEQSLDENKDKPIECLVCYKRFYDELSLQRHQQRNYKPLSHQCSVCGLKVRGGEALATHERSHRNEKPFECELCHKYFSSKGSLKAHMMVHSGEKPFVCTTCGWSFRRKRNLQVHILSHSDNQPFQCEICQKTFKSKVHLQYHMRTHTGEKPYPCRYCDKAFADHTNRQRHEMSHTGIKPYKCTYCDKTFIRKRFQVDHESSHTGIKPYRCDMCNRSFSHKTGLRRHLEAHPLAPGNAVALAAPSPMPAPASASSHMLSAADSSMSPPSSSMAPNGSMSDHGGGYFQHPQDFQYRMNLVFAMLSLLVAWRWHGRRKMFVATNWELLTATIWMDTEWHGHFGSILLFKTCLFEGDHERSSSVALGSFVSCQRKNACGSKSLRITLWFDMNICRICLKTGDEHSVPIFSKTIEINIPTLIATSCSVQLSENDGLPSTICKTCFADIQFLYNFIRNVQRSDTKLRDNRILTDENLSFEVVIVKTQTIDEEKYVPDEEAADFFSNQPIADTNTDGDKLSVIKERIKKESKEDDEENGNKSLETQQILQTIKLESDYESEVDNNDNLDKKELEMFRIINLPEANFVCCRCYQHFTTPTDYEAHIQEHTKFAAKRTDTIYCVICKRKFRNLKALDNHKTTFKQLSKLYECLQCKSRFISDVSRRKHAYKHPKTIEDKMKEEYGEILCCVQGCSEPFPSEELLIKHSQQNHKLHKRTHRLEDTSHKLVECPVCYNRYATEALLRRHRKRNSKPLAHQCATCGLKFRTRDVLLFHEMNHEEQKSFQCDVCKKYFSGRNALKVHLRSHSNKKHFVCPTCGIGFNQKSQLITHGYDHGDAPLPFECEVCKKSFKRKTSLINHTRSHTGERPFACRHCSVAFSSYTSRQLHEMIHTGSKPFKCTYCDETFTIKRLRMEHESKHTGIKPYKCSFCDKGFMRKQFLKDHETIHSGVKPYQCSLCDSSFRHQSNLRRHLTTHKRTQEIDATPTVTPDVLRIPPTGTIAVKNSKEFTWVSDGHHHLVMAQGTQFRCFDGETEEWELYKEQLEQYFAVSKVEEDMKKSVLINHCDSKTYKLLRDLCTPKTPAEKTYKELCDFLSKHFTPPVVSPRVCEEDESLTFEKAYEIAVKYETDEVKPSAVFHMGRGRNERGRAKLVARNSSRGNELRCLACNQQGHFKRDCRFKEYVCRKCNKRGHLQVACTARGNFFVEEQEEERQDSSSDANLEQHFISKLESSILTIGKQGFTDPMEIEVKIGNRMHKMQLDTGAAISVISFGYYKSSMSSYGLQLTNLRLTGYSGEQLTVRGVVEPRIVYGGVSKLVTFAVVQNGGPPLLGRNFVRAFNLKFASVNMVQDKVNHSLQQLLDRHKQLFSEGVGLYTHSTIKIELEDNAQPIFRKARPVAYKFVDKVESELDALEREGVITKCDNSKWGTPLVPVLKGDGNVRLCGDYKSTVNRQVKDVIHPLPTVDEVFSKLNGGKKFSKLDLSKCYNQFELDEESREICAISTNKGVYKMNRLPFGIRPASGIVQRELEKLLCGIPGVQNFLDDVLVTGATDEEHLRNLAKVFEVLEKAGLKLNRSKCQFFKDRVTYVGHVISAEGLRKTNDTIKSIQQAPQPKNIQEVRAFAGLVNHYARFVKNMADIMSPIYMLLKKGAKFIWSSECQMAFNRVKSKICRDVVLTHSNPKAKLIMVCDASMEGVSAVLVQAEENGHERPVAYASRVLHAAERNYSVIDREGLAIVYGLNKFFHYLIGNKFVIRTDHKPLLAIFNPHKGIPVIAASRMQRWANFLAGFNYRIEHVSSRENIADYPSRVPHESWQLWKEDDSYINFLNMDSTVKVDCEVLRRETDKDPELSTVRNWLKTGSSKDGSIREAFKRISSELSVEGDFVMRGLRVVIPKSLRRIVLDQVHRSHLGIVKSKSLLRSYVWWPNIDAELEQFIKDCYQCLTSHPSPEKAKLIPWEPPQKIWERVHLDFAGPVQGTSYLIVIDALSKWVEVFSTQKCDTEFVLNKMIECISRFGLMKEVVCDNGSQFTAAKFRSFLAANGVQLTLTSPGHPATNGQAENAVKTFKASLLKCLAGNKPNVQQIIVNFLLGYRNAEHCVTRMSPARMMMGRELRTSLDLMFPRSWRKTLVEQEARQAILNQQQSQVKNYKGNRDIEFEVDDKVIVRDYTNPNKASWTPGTVISKQGRRNWEVKLSKNGRVIKRHLNQMLRDERQVNAEGVILDDKQRDEFKNMKDTRVAENIWDLVPVKRSSIKEQETRAQVTLPVEQIQSEDENSQSEDDEVVTIMDKCRLCMVQEEENFISIFSIINNINIATTVASACSVMFILKQVNSRIFNMSICRICLQCKGESLISIFSNVNDINLASTITSSCSITLSENDGLPNLICESCVRDVEAVGAFVGKVRDSDAKLRSDKLLNDEKLSFEMIIVKLEEDEAQRVISDDGLEHNSAASINATDSDDDKLSTIKARVELTRKSNTSKVTSKNGKRNKIDDKKSIAKIKFKRKRKVKLESGDESEVADNNDTLDEKELEMFDIIILPEANFVCCCCRQNFKAQEDLDSHVEVHKKFLVKRTDTIHCEICKRRFIKHKALDNHRRIWKHVTKLFECRKCKSRFISAVSRRKHAYKHPKTIEDKMKQEYGEIICCVQRCSKSFPSEELLIKHSLETHKLDKQLSKPEEDDQRQAECPVCFKRFASERLLRIHRKRNSKPLSHQCTTCGLKFRSKDVLLFHESNHADQKPFQCDVCNKYFSSRSALKVHQRHHSNEKPFVCGTCGAGFYQKVQLTSHEYDHGNVPLPFKCEVCGKSFKIKKGLITHMRSHTGERPYPCRHCSMSFASYPIRRMHEMTHSDIKPFKCSYCDRTFTLKRLQLEHECKHTGIKPFKCNFCDKSFIRKQFQVDHESTHTGVKPYRCDKCNCSYSHKSNLNRHMETHQSASDSADVASVMPTVLPLLPDNAVGISSEISSTPTAPTGNVGEFGQ